MQLNVFNEFQKSAIDQGVLFYYSGYFSQTIITAMGDALRQRLNNHLDASNVARRRLFSTFVELAQNVVHYSAEHLTPMNASNHEIRRGAVWVGERDGRFFVVCANPLQRSEQERMREKLEPLRQMSNEEIKSRYREQRHLDSEAQSKGAGLGFLTVARDASEPIEFEFVDNGDSENIMFYLKATI
ncbi:SiaB family protein kinase [Paludibacterium yongneupense]|uniref:SiaB family protein kinase n=1 Tax=Paludibacterium yongneupense TaxID=400061 RepID=UPI00041A47B4|nr:SiaB family protein kinase [Paludibacterium yongneupense]